MYKHMPIHLLFRTIDPPPPKKHNNMPGGGGKQEIFKISSGKGERCAASLRENRLNLKGEIGGISCYENAVI